MLCQRDEKLLFAYRFSRYFRDSGILIQALKRQTYALSYDTYIFYIYYARINVLPHQTRGVRHTEMWSHSIWIRLTERLQ